MKTVQMTLDEDLLEAVDRKVKTLGTTRSAFTRKALQVALDHIHVLEQEEKHRDGYLRHPVEAGEFDGWEDEQSWGDS